jgi:hypothetical protein
MAPSKMKREADKVRTANRFETLEQQLIGARAWSTFHDPKLKYHPIESTRRLVTPKAIENEFRKFDVELLRLNEPEEEEDNDEGDDVNYDNGEDEEEVGSLDKADDDQESSKAFYRKFADYDQKELAQWVDKNAHTTFAIAVANNFSPLNLLPYMATFRARGFTDKDLKRMDDLVVKLNFRGDPASVERFCDQRWKFLALVFSTEEYDYDLPSDCTFPFRKDDSKSRKGAFGLVTKVLVHVEHQRHPGIKSVCVNAHLSTKKAEDL